MGAVLMVRTVSQVVREAVPKKTVEMHPQESEPVIAPTKGLDSLDLESLFSGLIKGLLPKPLWVLSNEARRREVLSLPAESFAGSMGINSQTRGGFFRLPI